MNHKMSLKHIFSLQVILEKGGNIQWDSPYNKSVFTSCWYYQDLLFWQNSWWSLSLTLLRLYFIRNSKNISQTSIYTCTFNENWGFNYDLKSILNYTSFIHIFVYSRLPTTSTYTSKTLRCIVILCIIISWEELFPEVPSFICHEICLSKNTPFSFLILLKWQNKRKRHIECKKTGLIYF